MKISGVYKITNKITGDFYIGSSKNIRKRWTEHRSPSVQKEHLGMLIYQAFQQYGLENFDFEIIEETDNLKNREQYFIDLLKPVYNTYAATTGMTIKEYNKQYQKSEKWHQYQKQYGKQYSKSEEGHQRQEQYRKSEKGRRAIRKAVTKYMNRPCDYNGEVLTFRALYQRFLRQGITNARQEAKKYLMK